MKRTADRRMFWLAIGLLALAALVILFSSGFFSTGLVGGKAPTPIPAACGNGSLDTGEQCDLSALGGDKCSTVWGGVCTSYCQCVSTPENPVINSPPPQTGVPPYTATDSCGIGLDCSGYCELSNGKPGNCGFTYGVCSCQPISGFD